MIAVFRAKKHEYLHKGREIGESIRHRVGKKGYRSGRGFYKVLEIDGKGAERE